MLEVTEQAKWKVLINLFSIWYAKWFWTLLHSPSRRFASIIFTVHLRCWGSYKIQCNEHIKCMMKKSWVWYFMLDRCAQHHLKSPFLNLSQFSLSWKLRAREKTQKHKSDIIWHQPKIDKSFNAMRLDKLDISFTTGKWKILAAHAQEKM